MKTKSIKIALLLALLSLLVLGCGGGGGESYINLPEGPKIIFRGGLGKITIRYTPPPPPIFRIANATDYIEFNYIKENYGIPDKPIIVEYTVEVSVISPTIIQRTSLPQFNDYIVRVIQGWTYTRFGKGAMRIKVDVAKKRIEVDPGRIVLVEAEAGKEVPRLGNVREMVRQVGFTVVKGTLF